MRDGVKLFTIVYSPKDSVDARIRSCCTGRRTDRRRTEPTHTAASLGPSPAFAAEKFIFVYQDVRGKFRSEGEFVVMRPLVPQPKPPKATDESTDTYDTIDWLVKNVPNNNGRVGQWGISYPGSQTVWGMIDAHPALKASSPQAPAIDMFLGDDFHHNGAFRLMYTFSWLAGNARPRAGATETRGGGFTYGTPDGYRFFLDAGTVANINEKYFNYSVPTWNEYMEHPNYDEYWERQNPLKHAKNITHAVLNVAGWFDAEDFYGPLETYKAVERTPSNKNRIVIGPWLHGGWASMPGDALGDIRFGSNDRRALPQRDRAAVLQVSPEGPGRRAGDRSHDVRDGRQRVEDVRHVAAQRRRHAHAVLPGRRRTVVHGAGSCVQPPRAGSTSTCPIPRSRCRGARRRARRRGICG